MRKKWFNVKEDTNEKRKKHEIISIYLQGKFYHKKKKSLEDLQCAKYYAMNLIEY